MSNQEPDGWCTYHPDKGFNLDSCGPEEIAAWYNHADFFDLDCHDKDIEFLKGLGWQSKPICLISPQELTRLRAVSEWAKEMWKRLNTIACGMQSPIDSAHADMLCQQYDAITAPEDKEGAI